ncbi:MAG: DUF1847 domain-containing protein [Candidatus Thermoplasmatota archaeon]|nr:DUF1847 domain-containing protein [Candidatus Thermoplasmatota archaeon]
MRCALCEKKECYAGKDCVQLKEVVQKRYTGEDLRSMEVSTSIESRYYMEKTRLEELILYARGMNYQRIGIAFCIGMEKEAKIIHKILENDFEVHSVCCKVCGIDKDQFGLEKLHSKVGLEAMCDPVGQAMVLNNEGTQMNVILGLCMGHDILFTKHSEAPVTTLAVKDRVLAHNPLGAIYSNYYLKRRFKGGFE